MGVIKFFSGGSSYCNCNNNQNVGNTIPDDKCVGCEYKETVKQWE